MRVQIKKLEGPDEILVGTIRPNVQEMDHATPTSAASANANDTGVFKCIFNRLLTPNDYSGTPSPSVNVTLKFYNSRGVYFGDQYDTVLNVTQADVTSDFSASWCYFTVTPGTELTGTSFYVHAIIPNDATDARDISFMNSSYHETIKHVQVYAEKEIKHVYWSDKRIIGVRRMDEEENLQNNATQTDERFVHIKTTGLFSETVRLRISGNNETLMEIRVPLYRNHKSVAISMKDMLARYCSIKGLAGDELRNVSLPLKASVSVVVENNNMLIKFGENMTLTADATDTVAQSANNGAVQVVVDTGEIYGEDTARYTDFTIGFMCHLEGVGEKAVRGDNAAVVNNNSSCHTVYPFHVYEILLSDLVKCGLVTLEEASYLTTRDHNTQGQNLRTRTDLENSFNKGTARLSPNKTLISTFIDSSFRDGNNALSLANGTNIRKVLAQVRNGNNMIENIPGQSVHLRRICRDAWESSSARTEARYGSSNECPFGEFFLNYVNANFKVFVARSWTDSTINSYDADANGLHPESPNRVERSGIAMHKGGSDTSIGCITFNRPWIKIKNDSVASKQANNFDVFNNLIYSSQLNARCLNFICIDERNAVKVSTTNHRFYDLVRP